MPDIATTQQTTLAPDEVVIRAVQFFSTQSWRVTSQSGRAVTLAGRPKLPWVHIILMIVAFSCFVIPGVIMYFLLIRKLMRFQNMVVTASPIPGGAEVSITYPPHAAKLAEKFLAALPPLP